MADDLERKRRRLERALRVLVPAWSQVLDALGDIFRELGDLATFLEGEEVPVEVANGIVRVSQTGSEFAEVMDALVQDLNGWLSFLNMGESWRI